MLYIKSILTQVHQGSLSHSIIRYTSNIFHIVAKHGKTNGNISLRATIVTIKGVALHNTIMLRLG